MLAKRHDGREGEDRDADLLVPEGGVSEDRHERLHARYRSTRMPATGSVNRLTFSRVFAVKTRLMSERAGTRIRGDAQNHQKLR